MLSYLDPGSGAVIVQAVAGGVAGFFVLVKMFGKRVFDVFLFWRKPAIAEGDEAADETADDTVESDPDALLDEQADATS